MQMGRKGDDEKTIKGEILQIDEKDKAEMKDD